MVSVTNNLNGVSLKIKQVLFCYSNTVVPNCGDFHRGEILAFQWEISSGRKFKVNKLVTNNQCKQSQ